MNGLTSLKAFTDGLPGRASDQPQKPKGDMLMTGSKQAAINHKTRAA